MLQFIVDECTGLSVVHFLRQQGYDAIGVSEALPQAIDADILERAVAENRVVITNDKDFGDMVFRDRRPHRGIVLLRLADDLVDTKLRVLSAVLTDHVDKLADRFVVATEDSIRIRSTVR